MTGAASERYCALSTCLRRHFNMSVQRIPLSLHQTCPNRREGRSGCVFCLPEAYEPPAAMTAGSVREQLERGMERHKGRGRAQGFIAYLQSGSNTCGRVKELRAVYEEALSVPGVVALSIATRPDCLAEPVVTLLDELAERHQIWVEVGIQSMQDRTLAWLQRGHDAACAAQALTTLMATRVQHVVAHMILGLPGETEDDMVASMQQVCSVRRTAPGGAFPRLGLKLHHLQVMRGTPLEAQWRAGTVPVLDLDNYARLVVTVLERVPADVVIHRLCAAAAAKYVCAPVWPGGPSAHIARIRAEFAARGTWQGRKIEE